MKEPVIDPVTVVWTSGLCAGAVWLYGLPGLWTLPLALFVIAADAGG